MIVVKFENCFVMKCIRNNCYTQYDYHFFSNSNYDFTHYDDFMRTYDKLRNFIYVYSMIKYFKIYIIYCSKCQINQIKRHFVYDEFTFIISSTIFFHIIIIKFIVKLSFNRDINVLFTITCKFFKNILLISNHDI